MKTYAFGNSNSMVSRIGQGTWNLHRASIRSRVKAIHRGIELGLTHIDTAEMYGSGRVEKFLSKALKGRRDDVFLVSKVMPQNASFNDTIEACNRSLKRLRTEVLDCYLLHWHAGPPMAETFSAFEKLVQDGKIRSWGVSNFTVAEMRQAVELVGPGKIACNQVEYNLNNRQPEVQLINWCREQNVSVVAHTPFGARPFPSPTDAGGRVLTEIAKRHACSARAIALAYLLRHDNVFVIPKAAKISHIEDNASAFGVCLSNDDIRSIGQHFELSSSLHS